jgi:hypothetical protein
MRTLTESDRQMLLKLLAEEEDHEPLLSFYSRGDIPVYCKPTCTCGYSCKTPAGLETHIKNNRRTFTTWQFMVWLVETGNCGHSLKGHYIFESSAIAWLFDPCRFCGLVAKFTLTRLPIGDTL